MEYRDSKRKPVPTGEAIGHGGEATIYKVIGQPKLLAKLYDRTPRNEYARKLVWMRDHPPTDPTAAQQHASLAWPVDLLFNDKGQLSGYLMPFIENAVPLLDVFNPRRCVEVLPDFNRRYLHRAARNLATALGALHARGYVVGDINESNILVTPRALVTMIDTDSFQVREAGRGRPLVHTCPVARLEYTPPELQGKSLQDAERSPEQDAFGLGVLIFQLLMGGSHPFRAQWLGPGESPPLEERIRQGCFPYRNPPTCPVAPPPGMPGLEVLHPAVAELVLRCFIEGHRHPKQRPAPDQWEKSLSEAEDNLILCQKGHYYSNHLGDCPVCNPRIAGRQAPLPALGNPRLTPGATGNKPKPVSRTANPASGTQPASSLPSAVRILPWGKVFRLGFPSISIKPFWRSARFTRQTLLDSLGKGALLGAGSGALGGGLLAILSWGISQALHWNPLLVIGAVLASTWRSLQIGRGFSFTVVRTIGWGKTLKLGLSLILAGLGAYLGGQISLSLQAIAIGGLIGAVVGWLSGYALYRYRPHIRWDLIGAGAVVLLFGWLAFLGGDWLADSWLGLSTGRLMSSMALWTDGLQVDRLWSSAAIGVIGGGCAGALAGSLTEILAELLGCRK